MARGALPLDEALTIDNGIFQIIGVMPAEFAFPAKDSQVWSEAKDAQIWLPINSDERWTRFQKVRVADAFGVVARLKAGVPVQQAQAEMAVVARRLAQKHAETDAELGIRVMPLTDYVVAPRLRLALWVFLGAVGLVLLIACANVAGLFVSRTFGRRKAFAIQVALGAGRSHILGSTGSVPAKGGLGKPAWNQVARVFGVRRMRAGNGAFDGDGIAAAKRDAVAASRFGIPRGSLDFDENSAAWSEVRRR